MIAKKIGIDWNPGLSVFASEPFLRTVSDEYGWLGGYDDSGKLKCILPYTIVNKSLLRMVRFRVETIPVDGSLDVDDEKSFLNSAMEYLRTVNADMVIPATTNTIFRTYPDGAYAAPYGSFIIDLSHPEEVLWRGMNRILRQNINTARRKGIKIREGIEDLSRVYLLIRDTFKRSRLPFMNYRSFERYVTGLGENCKILTADYQGVIQSYVVFAFSEYCVYAVYAGNVVSQQQGANKLLYWEAICLFKSLGVSFYDFVGARINPEAGSKQEALSMLKKHFGAKLKQGYMWKYPLNRSKYLLYAIASRIRSGGDIVDAERHKVKDFMLQNEIATSKRT